MKQKRILAFILAVVLIITTVNFCPEKSLAASNEELLKTVQELATSSDAQKDNEEEQEQPEPQQEVQETDEEYTEDGYVGIMPAPFSNPYITSVDEFKKVAVPFLNNIENGYLNHGYSRINGCCGLQKAGSNNAWCCTGFVATVLDRIYGLTYDTADVDTLLQLVKKEKKSSIIYDGSDSNVSGLLPGDIIFFINDNDATHTAIAGFNGNIYHAWYNGASFNGQRDTILNPLKDVINANGSASNNQTFNKIVAIRLLSNETEKIDNNKKLLKAKTNLLNGNNNFIQEKNTYVIEGNTVSSYLIDGNLLGSCVQHNKATTFDGTAGTFYYDAREKFGEDSAVYQFMLKAFAYAQVDSLVTAKNSDDMVNPLSSISDSEKRVCIAGLTSSVYRGYGGNCSIVSQYSNWLNTVAVPDICKDSVVPKLNKIDVTGTAGKNKDFQYNSKSYTKCNSITITGMAGKEYTITIPTNALLLIGDEKATGLKTITMPASGSIQVTPCVLSSLAPDDGEFCNPLSFSVIDTNNKIYQLAYFNTNADYLQDMAGLSYRSYGPVEFKASINRALAGSIKIKKIDAISSSSDLRAGFVVLGPIDNTDGSHKSESYLKNTVAENWCKEGNVLNIIPSATSYSINDFKKAKTADKSQSLFERWESSIAKSNSDTYLLATTNKSGNATIKDVPAGKYIIIETLYADDNMNPGRIDAMYRPFLHNGEKMKYYEINITDDDPTAEITACNNSNGKMTLKKTYTHPSYTNGKSYSLIGAEYSVYSVKTDNDKTATNDNLVAKFKITEYDKATSTGNGTVSYINSKYDTVSGLNNKTLTGLKPGYYMIKETKGPDDGSATIDTDVYHKKIGKGNVTINFVGADEEVHGKLSLTKKSTAETPYNIAGAVYKVYKGSVADANHIGTFVTDEKGNGHVTYNKYNPTNICSSSVPAVSDTHTIMDKLEASNEYLYSESEPKGIKYIIKETQAPYGFNVDEKSHVEYLTFDNISMTHNITSYEKAHFDPTQIVVQKVREQGTDDEAVYLKDAIFSIEYHKNIPYTTNMDPNVERTWYLKSGDNPKENVPDEYKHGVACMVCNQDGTNDTNYVVGNPITGKPSDPLYTYYDDELKGNAVQIPLGWIVVKELVAPDGYVLDDTVYTFQVTDKSNLKDLYISFDKKRIISNTEEIEISTVATDGKTKNNIGVVGKDAAINDVCTLKHLVEGDTYIIKGKLMDVATKKALVIDGKEITAEKKFTATSEDMEVPLTYTFDSTFVKGKDVVVFEELYKNSELVASEVDFDNKLQTISYSDVHTTINDNVTGKNITKPSEHIKLTDTVTYSNLVPGKEYIISGTLIDKRTGLAIKDDKGNEVKSKETVIVPKTKSGQANVEFEFSGINLSGTVMVCFESIKYNDIEICTHADINDEKQTDYVPGIKTLAKDVIVGNNLGVGKINSEIIDTVSYEGIKADGTSYRAKGVLYDSETGKKYIDADGKEVVSDTVFTPTASSGTVDVSFKFNGNNLINAGKRLVVYEELYLIEDEKEILISEHKDIKDLGQSIYYPEGHTRARDTKTGTNIAKADKKVVLKDTYYYSKLLPGKKYELVGTLMVKETKKPLKDKDGNPITGKVKFVPLLENGSVEVTFKFDGSLLEGKTLVVFETLYNNGIEVVVNADLSDEEETIHFPKLRTTARNSVNAGSEAKPDKEVKIVDTCMYNNLLPGKTYKVRGILVVKDSMKPVMNNGLLVMAENEFVAKTADGCIDNTFIFDATKLVNKQVVFYEELYLIEDGKEILVSEHKDINDEDQTIHFSNQPKTGDNTMIVLAIVLLLLSLLSFVILIVFVNKKK